MRTGTGLGWIAAVFGAGLAACAGGGVADDLEAAGSKAFQLTACTADSECDAGMACLVERCDASTGCVPDDSGRCVECPAEGTGLCMPIPNGGTTTSAASCFSGRLGDPAACGLKADWGRRAVDTCAVQGAELTDLHALSTCDDGRPGGVAFTCCAFGDEGTVPGDPGDPTVPPVGPACVTFTADFGGQAWTPEGLDPKTAVAERCAAMGLEITDIQVQADPAGTVEIWTVTCCPIGSVPPPVEEVCQELPFPGDAGPDPNEIALKVCSGLNLEMRGAKPYETGPDGVVRTWIAICCGGSEPPDPQPGTCTDLPIGDGTCGNPDDLKTQAVDQCAATGGQLVDILVRNTCADGSIGAIIATCCR